MACGDVAWTGEVFCAKAGGQHAARASQAATAARSARRKYRQCRVGSLKRAPFMVLRSAVRAQRTAIGMPLAGMRYVCCNSFKQTRWERLGPFA